ncbi:MAG: EAL domain-containing protein [Nostoc sp.]|uniref:EAL domain-containing protein n=1 Tax=Nostoc sp. TaxID=1180 RepID=UPI002FF6EE3D
MVRQLKGYHHTQILREDSSTIIYRGIKELDRTPVIIKYIKTKYPTIEDIARLKYEYKVLQSLKIVGVIKCYVLEDKHQFGAIILEDFGGEPLSKYLSQKSFDLSEFLEVGIQLAETLANLHQYQVTHNNLKPGNVFFNPQTGQVKIDDFSLATYLDEEKQTISNQNFFEDAFYISPEQTGRMNRLVDYRTDFYSLGIIFYEILTGQLPCQSNELLELVHCHIAKIPIPPSIIAKNLGLREIPQVVSDIVMKLLAKTAEERYQNGLVNHTILIARNGDEFAIDDSAAPIRASNGEIIGAVMVFHYVSRTRTLSRQLFWQASHDSLTGLLNRREFERHLQQTINDAKVHNQQHALCYLDLDQFKIVNDTCGHIAGDELLRQVTALFQGQVRKTDTLARIGGDEFGLLLNQCSLQQAQRVSNTIRQKVQELRFIWQEKLFTIGISIGLVMIDTQSKSVAHVLSLADAACYAAKNRGRNRVQVYQVDDVELLRHKGEMEWVTRITQALEENRFCLYYQTIIPVLPTQIEEQHYEVLLRLQDETGALVLPMAFIPAAERYNLMHLIDRWVIRTLFTTQGQHYRNSWNDYQSRNQPCNSIYAINLSGASINDDQFIEFLDEQFALHQIPPQMICFEITETLAISNLAKASLFISELRSLGCRFALDDFGSGMSSFTYLKNLPVDFLKIDSSFIRQILDSSIDLAMVEAINNIGHIMGLQTIAEFVESDAILEKIKGLGVDYAQGYSIAKPCSFA